MVNVGCIQCGKEFEAQRKSAKFCSDNCRVKYNNLLKTVENEPKEPSRPATQQEYGSWVKEIYDYCRSKGFHPEYLIEFHDLHANTEVSKALMTIKKGIESKIPTGNRKMVTTDGGKNREMYEPEEGTNAHILRYGAAYKKDIQK